ncbi:hypothetical protein P8452_09331 [Trifolium repens]|nr:hypothetical protein P8452_09331 [Trifolium repens]
MHLVCKGNPPLGSKAIPTIKVAKEYYTGKYVKEEFYGHTEPLPEARVHVSSLIKQRSLTKRQQGLIENMRDAGLVWKMACFV